MKISIPKFRMKSAPKILPVDLLTFRGRFAKVLLGQLIFFTAFYIASVYVWHFSSPVYQVYIQVPVLCAVIFLECWLFKKLGLAGRLLDVYPKIKNPSLPLLSLSLCIPLMAAWIFFVALTKPAGRDDSKPWWLSGGVMSYGLILSFYCFIPALLGAFLGATEHHRGHEKIKQVSYWTFNPTGYYLVHLGQMVSEIKAKQRQWKDLPTTEHSDAVRIYAKEADLNGTGMILIFADLVTLKVKERSPASSTDSVRGVKFVEDFFYLSNIWTTKTTSLGSFSPLMIISPGAMLEASLITMVVNVIDLHFAVKLVDLLNSMASSIEAKSRSDKMLAADLRNEVRESKIYKVRRDVQSSWLKEHYR